MSVPAIMVLAAYALVVSFWKALHLVLLFYKPKRFFLRAKDRHLANDGGPLVSILVAAKDEEADIGACVRSVLRSEYEKLELIVIDDRSTDRTSAEAEKAAAGDSRVRVIQIKELPAGWTGKMNAVRQGLATARGEVVLLLDADTRPSPRALGIALAMFKRRNLQLLSLLPALDNHSFLFQLLQPLVSMLLFIYKPLPLVNSKKRKSMAFCYGGFLMMHRKTLVSVGGLEAIKGRIAADIALFRQFKQCGYRARLLHAPELIASYFYRSMGDMIAGCTRNLRVTVEGRALLLLPALLGILLLSLSAYPAVAVGLLELLRGTNRPFPLMIGMMGLGHLVFQLSLLGRIYRFSNTSPLFALGHLPAAIFACYLIVLTMIRCRRQHMVWRGTNYQLSTDSQPCSV